SLPKDMNHPYGHGKVEFFSVFIEGALIFLAALFIIGKSIYNFFFPIELTNLLEGVGLVAFTALINFLLGRYLLVKSKKLSSLTLMADGKHLLTDALSTVGLVVGLLLVYFTGLIIIDIILSLILGVFI